MAFAMMAVFSLSFVSCGSDDDEGDNGSNGVAGSSALVGTWDYISSITYSIYNSEPKDNKRDDAYWVITEDKLTVHDKKDLANGKSVNYTYNSNSKELNIVGFPLYTVIELTNSTLVIRSQEILGSYNINKFKKR